MLPPLKGFAELVQTNHDHNWVLQNTIDLTYDLNQQTYVVFCQVQAQQEELSIPMEMNAGEDDGECCPHEAPADVVALQKHQGPVEETFRSQTEQNEVDGVIHDVFSTGAHPAYQAILETLLRL
ncbi:hypothetical protein Q5P01_022690 [Channa striata]|uniref:Uncharacterized protein n=1 Tax=Channa striata TaxID=64152 RepID=A0AA88S784_CHASR|nr:hypothetical protein Q5P01_022690 [Channa striata]